MARIPQFTQKVFLNRSGAKSIGAASAAGGGVAARQHSLNAQQAEQNARRAGAEATSLTRERKTEENNLAIQKKADGKLRAQERYNQFKREIIPEYQERRNAAQADPGGFADSFDQFHREQSALIEEEVNLLGDGKDFNLDHFRQLADRDRTATFEKSFNFESGQRVKNTFTGAEKAIDDMNANFALSNPDWKGFVDHQKAIGDYAMEVGKEILSPQDTLKLTEFGIDNAAQDFLFRQMQDNPTAARRVIEYGQGGRDALTDFIMMDIEGGAKIAQEPDGGIAKYGINSIANPNVDVRNLTAEGAAEILKTKYYDKRLDKFDSQFQAVAYDALVNHGNDKDTWRMIDEANGNPYSLIVLRQEKYAGLVAANPDKYAGYAEGWGNRMNKLTDYVQTLDGGGEDFLKHASLVDSAILSNARAKIPQALADKEKSRKAELEIANTISVFTIKSNEDELNKLIYDENVSHEKKIQALREADFKNIIGDKYAAEAEKFLAGVKALKKAEYDPNAIADMYVRKELMFNKSNKDGKKRVTVSEGMLDDIGDMMVETMQKSRSGEITPSETKAMMKSLGSDLTAAGEGIGKPSYTASYTHDEKAFRYFGGVTDNPAFRNRMFMSYSEKSTGLDGIDSAGLSDKEVTKAMQKIADEVLLEHLFEEVPGAASLDKPPNQVFTIDGDRIFVGAHSNRPKADASISNKNVIKIIDGVKFRMNPDGKSGVRIE